MDIIYIGFCLNDFNDFNEYLDFVNTKLGKTVYIFEQVGNVSTFNEKKLQKLKSVAVNLSIYKKDGSVDMLPKNTKGKIQEAFVILLKYDQPLNTIIKHRESSTFILFMPKCSPLLYKEFITKFKNNKLYIYGRDIVKVVKELISDPKIKKKDMIDYLNYLKDFKVTPYKNICMWENFIDVDDSYIYSSSDKTINDLALSVDKMLPLVKN